MPAEKTAKIRQKFMDLFPSSALAKHSKRKRLDFSSREIREETKTEIELEEVLKTMFQKDLFLTLTAPDLLPDCLLIKVPTGTPLLPSMHFSNIKCIILDIEGTTTPIKFVKDVLFSYIKKHIASFMKEHWQDWDITNDIEELRKQADIDVKNRIAGAVRIPHVVNNTPHEIHEMIETVVKNVLFNMSVDRKTTSLKQLQGHIWAEAYEKNQITSQVYDDVEFRMRIWKGKGIKIYIYSSGSTDAQKLLFRYSNHGDLTEHIDGYFDTNTGQKTDPASYVKILNLTEMNAESTLFLTDLPKEAYAAREAGITAILVERFGNLPIEDFDKDIFPCINSFIQLELV